MPDQPTVQQSQLRRFDRYRELLQQRPHSKAELAAAVERAAKTVQRDLDFLRQEWNWPIAYDAQTRCWQASGPLSRALLSLTDEQAVALLMAEPALRAYGAGPFGPALQSAITHIIQALDAPVRPMRPPVEFGLNAARETDGHLFRRITRAARERETLSILYRSPQGGDPAERTVDPYLVENFEGAWYLVGYCHTRRALRDFAISPLRMLDLRGTGCHFEPDPALDIEEHLKSGFGMMRSTPDKEIVLRFAPQQRVYQLERLPWPGEEREELENGCLRVRFPAPVAISLVRWVLQFGGEVMVEQPAELREWVVKEARAVVERG